MLGNNHKQSSEEIEDGPRFLSVSEFMRRTSISRASVGRYIKKGVIPVTRIGRRIIIDMEVLFQLKRQSSDSKKEDKE